MTKTDTSNNRATLGGRDLSASPVIITELERIQTSIAERVRVNDDMALLAFLRSSYRHSNEQPNNPSSVLTFLVTEQPEYYQALLSTASPSCKKTLLNFSNLNLAGINFNALSEIDFSEADFTRCDFRKTQGLTQALLDSAQTSANAILPKGFVASWSDEKRALVMEKLDELQQYGSMLSESARGSGPGLSNTTISINEAKLKDSEIGQHSALLSIRILTTKKLNGQFQADFLRSLHSKDDMINQKRDLGLKCLVANLSLLVLGLGVGYVVAGVAHKAITGRFLFFSRTESEQKVASTEQAITMSR